MGHGVGRADLSRRGAPEPGPPLTKLGESDPKALPTFTGRERAQQCPQLGSQHIPYPRVTQLIVLPQGAEANVDVKVLLSVLLSMNINMQQWETAPTHAEGT